ncbi:hypothetical protein [Hydrocarboniphaga sp.]|uniref:hypothetical protein n=1 Tax=Hydrocarboniphaga sp. TaxID=2033016 RepID=UPI003D1070CB
MKTTIKLAAGLLLLATSTLTLAVEPRAGQAGVDTLREQAMMQLRADNLASLQPRIERNLIAANQAAAPRQMVAAGMPLAGPKPDRAAR